MTPEIQRGAKNDALWTSLAALDAYRRKFEAAPAALRNPVLLGSILIPLGLMPRTERRHFEPVEDEPDEVDGNAIEPQVEVLARRSLAKAAKFRRPPKEPILKIGMLPIARGDTERLRQVLSLQVENRGSRNVTAGQALADASRAVRGLADVVRDPRPRAGRARALEGIYRSAR